MSEVVYQSPFGDWRVRSRPPPIDLAPYVDELWETHGTVGYGYEKLLPTGNAEFMINLGPPQAVLQRPTDKSPATFREAWLAGIQGAPLFTAPAHGSDTFTAHLVSASLRPEGVCELFGVPAVDTASRVVDADDLIGRDVRAVRERIGEAPDTRCRFDVLVEFLRARRSRWARPVPPTAVWAMRRTLALDGKLRIADLCAELGVSRKHLNDIYKCAAGLSPKTYARLTRFRSVVNLLQGPIEPWVSIATDRGYFDQAHLIRDFRKFAGESPTSFLKSRGPDGESVSFAEVPDPI